MKKVLSLLVAFVFLQTQTWALSGGPVFSGSQASVKGTYAGVLIPSIPGNSLGIFVLGAPTEGLATGNFAMFTNGSSFYGSIVGIIDPKKLTLSALAQAQQNQTLSLVDSTGRLQILSVPNQLASGQIQAKLKAESGVVGTSGFRMTGTGALSTFTLPAGGGAPVPAGTIDMVVDGFQQSQTVTGQVNINQLTSTQAQQTAAP